MTDELTDELKEIQHLKCSRCRCWRIPVNFLNAKGRKLKTCSNCRASGRKAIVKTKCHHNRQKAQCKECDPIGHLSSIIRGRIYQALGNNKKLSPTEYIGCTTEHFKEHIEKQFKDNMNWDNYGKWHIDHRIPLKYNNPTLEQTIQRLHWTNTQPMWAEENMAKGNRYIG